MATLMIQGTSSDAGKTTFYRLQKQYEVVLVEGA